MRRSEGILILTLEKVDDKIVGLMKRCLGDNKGMALLLTVVVISLLVVATLQFGRESRQAIIASVNVKDRGALKGIARSGINIAKAVLVKDLEENSYDTLNDSWNMLGDQHFPSFFLHGMLELTVRDLSGRFQINSLSSNESSEVFKRLLLSGNFAVEDESQAIEIIHALIDWIDSDSRQSDFGAEDAYYKSLSKPYGCKNGSIEFIEELLLVKGVTAELLYGSQEKKGLSEYITVHGSDGKVNINTADAVVIQALHEDMTEELTAQVMNFRRQKENRDQLSSLEWYRNVSTWPKDMTLDSGLIGVESRYFQIEATGVKGDLTKRITEVVQRDAAADDKIIFLTRKVD